MTRGGRSLLILVLAGVPAPVPCQDLASAQAARIVGEAGRAAEARWAAVTAAEAQADPPVTWGLWGREEGTAPETALLQGGLKVGTPWGSVQAELRQNPAPVSPGGRVAVEIPVLDGEPGGRWAAWNEGRRLADLRARAEGAAELRATADRALRRLRSGLQGWSDRRTLDLEAREARFRLAGAEASPDRFTDRDLDRLRTEVRLLELQTALAGRVPGDRSLAEAVLAEPAGTPAEAVTPADGRFRSRPGALEEELRWQEAGFSAARSQAAALPRASVSLGASRSSWEQGPPILEAELRLTGSFGPAPPARRLPPSPVPGEPAPDPRLRETLARIGLDRARRTLDLTQADQGREQELRRQAGTADPPAELREARDLQKARSEVLAAWLAVVEASVDRALSPLPQDPAALED